MGTRIISVAMQKGGSGKTTTCVSLAGVLSQLGHRVLAIDLDAQSTATSWLRSLSSENSVASVFFNHAQLESVVVESPFENISVAPASEALYNAERNLLPQKNHQLILREALEDLSGWDYVLIDCPPHLGVMMTNALVASTDVLIPVELRDIALPGLYQLFQTITATQEGFNSELNVAGILPTKLNRTRHAKDALADLSRRFKDLVFNTPIRETIKLSDAFKARTPISLYSPQSLAAKDYRKLTTELLDQP